MIETFWKIKRGDSPFIASAIHDGHAVRDEVLPLFAVDDTTRRREEDPYTAQWTKIAPTQIIVCHSRFEVDMNRSRKNAVYINPEDAWGIQVWKHPPPNPIIATSLAQYDAFYSAIHQLLTETLDRFDKFFVLDIHSYNHRRGGPDAPLDDPSQNPDIDLGTSGIDLDQWGKLIDQITENLRQFDFLGRQLDVRENVRFPGGNLISWINQTFSPNGCALALEVKKFFMNEWTGELDPKQHNAIYQLLKSIKPLILKSL